MFLDKHEILTELSGIRTVILPDERYGIVDEDYLKRQFIPWFIKDWCFHAGLSYATETRDCDKFARAFAAQAQFASWRTESRVSAAVGWMAVKDYGGHAINLARVQNGWIEIEPQNGRRRPFRSDRSTIMYVVL